MKTPQTYEEYCLDFPEETQEILENLKNFIQNLFPESELCINYGIPTFKIKGKNVIHFWRFQKPYRFVSRFRSHRNLRRKIKEIQNI